MKQFLVIPEISIKKALKALNQAGEKCLVVADESNSMIGTLSDGDLRLVKAITRLQLPCAVILGNHDRGRDRSGERLRQQLSMLLG